jgi:hypothetical protein
MKSNRMATATLLAVVAAGGVLVQGQAGQPAAQGGLPSTLPLAPTIREHGTSITPAFEGWFHGKDGFDHMLVGYFNRNIKEEFDVPIGPNNKIEPGGPDQGQPTHFLLGRQWGVFSIKVPKDFGKKTITWTLTVNGLANSIGLHLTPDYIVEPFKSSWNNNTPPVLKFSPTGVSLAGPPVTAIDATYTATVGQPLPLAAWITDDGVGRTALAGAEPTGAPPAPVAAPGGRGARGGGAAAAGAGPGGGGRGSGVSLTWTLYRGPAAVTFANAKPAVDAASGGKAETTATFSAPGEYVLRAQANDVSGEGGGGEQCCWTNGHVRVTVKGAGQ